MRLMLTTLFLATALWSADASPLKLYSGKVVEIESVGEMHFAKGSPALVLRYRTVLSIDDLAAVRKEADEIWQHFVIDADRGKFENALIWANGPQTGFIIKTGKSYGFAYRKVDGFWHAVEPQTDATTKLTDKLVRQFLDHRDWLYRNDKGRAISLYLSPSWRLAVSGSTDGPPELSRKDFVESLTETHGKTELLKYERRILRIEINPTTNTAHVESRETTERKHPGGQVNLTERTTDDVLLRDMMMTIVKSTSHVEEIKQSPPVK